MTNFDVHPKKKKKAALFMDGFLFNNEYMETLFSRGPLTRENQLGKSGTIVKLNPPCQSHLLSVPKFGSFWSHFQKSAPHLLLDLTRSHSHPHTDTHFFNTRVKIYHL